MPEKIIGDWSRFYLQPDKDREGNLVYRIRRYRHVSGKIKWQSYPDDYDSYASKASLERLLVQINIRFESAFAKAKQAYEWRHTFITESLMEEFKDHLKAQIPSESWQSSIYPYCRKNLNWFIEKCRQPDPLEWKGLQDRWNRALFCKLEGTQADKYKLWDKPVHPDTVSKQVQAMNKLLTWLHEKDSRAFPAIQLKPYSKAVMKDYRSRWRKTQEVPGKFIELADQKIILEKISADLRPFVIFWIKI